MTKRLRDLSDYERIGGGKTKDVYAPSDSSKTVLIRSRDDIMSNDGRRRDTMPGKAELCTTTTTNNFTYLSQQQISTHFRHQVDPVTFEAYRCTPIPIECVARRYAAGRSFRRRETWIPQHFRFDEPVIELFWKDDDFADPYMEWDEKFELFRLYQADRPIVPGRQILLLNPSMIPGTEKYKYRFRALHIEMLIDTKVAFLSLEDAYARVGLTVVDFKIEFGIDGDGNLRIIDVINADSWHAWANGDPEQSVDKDYFSHHPDEPAETSLPAYRLVAEKSAEIVQSL